MQEVKEGEFFALDGVFESSVREFWCFELAAVAWYAESCFFASDGVEADVMIAICTRAFVHGGSSVFFVMAHSASSECVTIHYAGLVLRILGYHIFKYFVSRDLV